MAKKRRQNRVKITNPKQFRNTLSKVRNTKYKVNPADKSTLLGRAFNAEQVTRNKLSKAQEETLANKIANQLVKRFSTKEFKDRDWDVYRNHRVGFIFQSYNLIPHQTVLENVELALTIGGVSKEERIENK